MKIRHFICSLTLTSAALLPSLSYAAKSVGDLDVVPTLSNKDRVFVPYVFGTDSLGFSAGVAGLFRGVGQEQASIFGAGFASTKGSYMLYLAANNYKLGDNWLWGMDGYLASFSDYDYYTGEATKNDSDMDDSIEADGDESRYRMRFRYVLPLAEARHKGADAYYFPERDINGHLPWESGVTSFEIEPFYHKRDLSDVRDSDLDSTWGVKLGLEWDNRDDIRSPTKGSYTSIDYTYAPEQGDVDSWSMVEFQNSQYWNLGKWDGVFNEQVFAFDFYTATSPNSGDCDDGTCHQAPEYAGIKLGGLYHLRSYSTARYTGNAAIHYSAEYRVKPEWQPLSGWPIFKWYDVPWWQWAVFADVGRVADDYDLGDLHEDMQWSAGAGIRFQVEGVLVRTAMAWGEEESTFRVMVNQPF